MVIEIRGWNRVRNVNVCTLPWIKIHIPFTDNLYLCIAREYRWPLDRNLRAEEMKGMTND